MNNKVYQIVQENIINQLKDAIENGTCAPWKKPWVGTNAMMNYVSRKEYSGINRLLLPNVGEYLTFNQIKELQKKDSTIKLKKGSKSKMIVFWKFLENKKEDDSNILFVEDDEVKSTKKIPLCRYYNVFHISDVEGLESKIKIAKYEHSSNEEVERVIQLYMEKYGIEIEIKQNSNKAYCAGKKVVMPDKSQFQNLDEYYSTLFHELVHSTGHKDLLNRPKHNLQGDEIYSREELVAEIGSNLILSKFGLLDTNTSSNSISYLRSWLKPIKDDVSFIVVAAQQAEKAANLILNQNNEAELNQA